MKHTNKGLRNEHTRRHYRRRLQLYKLTDSENGHYALKSTGKPCSCYICKQPRYKRERLNLSAAE